MCGQVPQICLCGCAACDGQALSSRSTAAPADGEMDLGGKQEGRVFGRSDWCERGEAGRGKGVRRRDARWREHACWPPVWTHYIFIG